MNTDILVLVLNVIFTFEKNRPLLGSISETHIIYSHTNKISDKRRRFLHHNELNTICFYDDGAFGIFIPFNVVNFFGRFRGNPHI
jgi:hypothetical protein